MVQCNLFITRAMEANTGTHTGLPRRYAASVNAVHFNTSAKLNKGINDCFLKLTQSSAMSWQL